VRRDVEMTFMEHLEELRDRIVYCLYAIVPAMAISFSFAKPLLKFITDHARRHGVGTGQNAWQVDISISPIYGPFFTLRPETLANNTLQTLSPVEFPIQYMKVAFVASIFLVFPFIMLQVWRFVEPGLKDAERKYIGPFLLFSWLFFIFGGLFAYFGMLEVAVPMLLSFGEGITVNAWSLGNYVSFVLRMFLAFGIVFEMPVIAALLSILGIVTPEFLRHYRRYAILIMAIVAAILTPPDPWTMMLMGVPLLMLYEVSILVSKFFQRKPMDLNPKT
jgi:sec-independent protein translocase protein TatC